MRVALLLVVAVLAFAGGLALRTWRGDTRDTAREPVARPLHSARSGAPIKLLTADPGTLRRPAASPTPRAAPVAAAAPAPAPVPGVPSVPRTGGGTSQPTFDSTGEEASPSPVFDIEG